MALSHSILFRQRGRITLLGVMVGKPQIEAVLGRRKGWTPIALLMQRLGSTHGPMLLDLAREQRWQLVSLNKFDGNLPSHITVRGAMTDVLPSHEHSMALRELGIPIVRIGSWPHPDDSEVPAVIPDNVAAGRLAADHFAQRDFKHVACLGHIPWGENESTYHAFAARAEDLGCTAHLFRQEDLRLEKFANTAERLKQRQRQFSEWINALPRPCGLLAFSDVLADQYCHWIVDAGLRVPQDIAVLSIGNDPLLCECAAVPISAIDHDDAGLIRTAVDVLARLMAGEPLEQCTIPVPPLGVVTRQSTDVLATADPFVVKALQFMWDHMEDDLTVDAIAEHAGTSRRTLEKAFARDLGRGINQEYQRRRLEKARDLLLQTDMPIATIADTLGFGSRSHFFDAFRRAHGTSPGRYRRDADPIA